MSLFSTVPGMFIGSDWLAKKATSPSESSLEYTRNSSTAPEYWPQVSYGDTQAMPKNGLLTNRCMGAPPELNENAVLELLESAVDVET